MNIIPNQAETEYIKNLLREDDNELKLLLAVSHADPTSIFFGGASEIYARHPNEFSMSVDEFQLAFDYLSRKLLFSDARRRLRLSEAGEERITELQLGKSEFEKERLLNEIKAQEEETVKAIERKILHRENFWWWLTPSISLLAVVISLFAIYYDSYDDTELKIEIQNLKNEIQKLKENTVTNDDLVNTLDRIYPDSTIINRAK